MTQSVLITGGAGFVGSQLGSRLAAVGHDVVLLDDMSTGKLDNLVVNGETFGRLVVADVRSPEVIKHFDGVDVVFHFAGIAALPVCQSDPAYALSVNTSGTANVLECARLTGVAKTIFSSTSAVYEKTPTPRHRESDSLAPDLTYALSKVFAESLCQAYSKNYGMNIIICRFFNVYGPHQDFLRPSPPFTSYLAREVVAGRVPTIYNSSDVKRDYVHVDDVVDLLTRMMDAERPYQAEVFNVASGEGFSVPEIWKMMQKISGSQIEPEFRSPEAFWDAYPILFEGPHPLSRARISDEVYKEALGDNARTRAEFAWTPRIELEEGLRSVYDYARAHLSPGSS